MKWIKQIIFATSCAVLLSSCLNPVDVNVNSYALDSISTEQFGQQNQGETLLVMTPTASPGYQSNQIVYVEQPYLLRAYARNEWVAPPAQMLSPLLEESIRNTGYFKTVVKQPFSGMSERRLTVEILRLQQQFFQQPSEVYMELKADLIDSKTNKVIASDVFKTSVSVSSPTPYGSVVAANEATQILLEKIAQFVVENNYLA